MKFKLASLLITSCLAVSAAAQSDAPKQPVYIYLYARITDQVNLDMTEDRIHRVLSMVDTYRQTHPEVHVSATLLFSGAVSNALAERNSQSHIVDFVKGYIQRGVIEAGYDGSDEPTYESRPSVDFTQISDPERRWEVRKTGEEKFLTQGRDPLTGAPEAGKSGGLKKMQEVFGEAHCVTGVYPLMRIGEASGVMRAVTKPRVVDQNPKTVILPPGLMPEVGGDSEEVSIIKSFSSQTIMFGVPDMNPAKIPGFRDGRLEFGRLISPGLDTAPELYWQDNMLRSSEASDDVLRLVHAYAGPEAIKTEFGKVSRNKIHVIHVELGDEQDYLQPIFVKGPDYPALQYAYSHQSAPALPATVLLAKSDVDAAFAKEEATLKWLTDQFLPADAGSRFVSSTDLSHMVTPATGFSLSMNGLQSALSEFLKTWGTDTFSPPLFKADGHYLSRAELFQVTADALAQFHKTGKLPTSVEVIPVYGPVRVLTGHGPNVGEVSVAEVARICADIAAGMHEKTSGLVPKNSVPIGVTVSGAIINPAQFLKLMAAAIVNPTPDAKLDIHMAYEFIAVGQVMPRTRPDMDDGFIWTLKPATLEGKLEARIAP